MRTTGGSPRASGSGCRHGHPPAGKVPDAPRRLGDSGGGVRTVPPWPTLGAGRVGPRSVVERIGAVTGRCHRSRGGLRWSVLARVFVTGPPPTPVLVPHSRCR